VVWTSARGGGGGKRPLQTPVTKQKGDVDVSFVEEKKKRKIDNTERSTNREKWPKGEKGICRHHTRKNKGRELKAHTMRRAVGNQELHEKPAEKEVKKPIGLTIVSE